MKTFIATKPGFYGKLRSPGEVFEVTDETPLGSWVKSERDSDNDPDALLVREKPNTEVSDHSAHGVVHPNQDRVSVHDVKSSGGKPTGKK